MTGPRIVIDTNVLVAGLRSRTGASFKLLGLIGRDKFEVCLSVPLVLEYEDVLLRHLDALTLSKQDVHDFLDYVIAVSEHHEIHYLWRPTLRDPNDEMLLELAVKAQCKSIVTFNKLDFKGSNEFGIELLSPAEFLSTVR